MVQLTRRDVLVGASSVAAAAMMPLPSIESATVEAATAQAAPATAAEAKAGRWAVQSYLSAWHQLCEATWQHELEDPIFRKAVAVAKTANIRPADGAHWLAQEAWRNDVRSWWFAARHHYRSPDDVTAEWVAEQRSRDTKHHLDWLHLLTWEPNREATLVWERAWRTDRRRQDEHWSCLVALIETGAFWPLHLDIHRSAAPFQRTDTLRAQFDAMPGWAAAASSVSACPSLWQRQALDDADQRAKQANPPWSPDRR